MDTLAWAAALALAAGAASAGTLSIGFDGGPQTLTDTTAGEAEISTVPPYGGTFVFSVPGLSGPVFDYAVDYDYSLLEDPPTSAIENPYGATLLSRPDGHLGGYYDLDFSISVRPDLVSVSGYLADSDDVTVLTPTSVLEDHNQGLFYYESTGIWTASYSPDGAGDGAAFSVPGEPVAAVPLPAAGGLLLAALAGIGAVRRRRG